VEPAIQKIAPVDAALRRALIDIDELSTRLCIAKGTLYNWVYLRRIPFVKLGRALRFDPLEIERVLQASSTLEEVGRR
jgi:excisionase family DNA binding protein